MRGGGAGVRRDPDSEVGGSCRCYSTTVSVGFRLILPARHGKIGVSYASSAASHSLLHLHFPEKKKISLTIL